MNERIRVPRLRATIESVLGNATVHVEPETLLALIDLAEIAHQFNDLAEPVYGPFDAALKRFDFGDDELQARLDAERDQHARSDYTHPLDRFTGSYTLHERRA